MRRCASPPLSSVVFLAAGAALALALLVLSYRRFGRPAAVGLAESSTTTPAVADMPRVRGGADLATVSATSAYAAVSIDAPQWWTGPWPDIRKAKKIADALRAGDAAGVPVDPAAPARLLLAADGVFGHIPVYDQEEYEGRDNWTSPPRSTPWARRLEGACRARHATRTLTLSEEVVRLTRPGEGPEAQGLPELARVRGRPTRRALVLPLVDRTRGVREHRLEMRDNNTATTFQRDPHRDTLWVAHRGALRAWLVSPTFDQYMVPTPTDDTDNRCVHASRFTSFEKLPMVHHAQVRLKHDDTRALLVPAGWWCQVQAANGDTIVSVLALERA